MTLPIGQSYELRLVEEKVADILREQDEADAPETAVLDNG